MAVNSREGQLIKKGDSLIEIDPRPYRATLLQAQGTLERDQNVLAQAQMDLKRYQAAWRASHCQQTVDDQEKLVLQDQGTVKNDQGTVQFDQMQLDYCHITAPIDGQVGLRLVDPGNVVQANGTHRAGGHHAGAAHHGHLHVIRGQPGARARATARRHQAARSSVRSHRAETAGERQLLALDNQIDTTTGTVKVRAIFDNKDNALFPNQFVNTRLLVNTLHGVTLVPTRRPSAERPVRLRLCHPEQRRALRPVKVGVTDAGMTQVTGINPATCWPTAASTSCRTTPGHLVSPPHGGNGGTPAITMARQPRRGRASGSTAAPAP